MGDSVIPSQNSVIFPGKKERIEKLSHLLVRGVAVGLSFSWSDAYFLRTKITTAAAPTTATAANPAAIPAIPKISIPGITLWTFKT